jgi:hypothetical protein
MDRGIPSLLLFASIFASSARGQAQDRRTTRFAAGPLTAVVVFEDTGVARLDPQLRTLLPAAVNRYHGLFGGPPRESNGNRLDTITIALASASVSEGESSAGRVRVAVGKRPVFGFYDWRLVLLHELFHLWNAESFGYTSGAEQWFNEGITEFYTMQTAGRLGLVEPLQLVDHSATALGFYTSAPNVGTISLTDAASTPDRKFRNYFLVYYGGWMAGLVLDHDIRARTNGRRSLDDVMRRMYENFDRRTRLYATSDIVAQLRAATEIDYKAFFERYIRGPTPLPVARHLSLGDLAFVLTAPAANPRGREIDRHLLASLGLGQTMR